MKNKFAKHFSGKSVLLVWVALCLVLCISLVGCNVAEQPSSSTEPSSSSVEPSSSV